MRPGTNSIERYKAEKDGLEISNEIEEIAAQHGGWETIDPGDRERLKWLGAFFRKPTPGFFMIRIRITGGQATSEQVRTLAEIGHRLGNGILDITTRQQIQLRGIKIKDVPDILKVLRNIDLSSLQTGMDNVRNVITCPLAGLTPDELLDASPVGKELTRIFLGNSDFTNLPRKFNIAISGCLENCIHAESQDVGMTPAIHNSDGAPGFNIMVGGKTSSGGMTVALPLDVFVEPGDTARLATEIVLLFRDKGKRDQRTEARLAFLLKDWGIEKFRACLEERWGRPLEHAQRDVRKPHHTDHLGVHPQKQPGLYSVGLHVPTGRLTSSQLIELARLADQYGNGQIRLTTGQNAILVNIQEKGLEDLLREPLLQHFSPSPHPFFRGLVTCTGTDYCNLALIETKSIAKRLAETLAKRYPEMSDITMHWSGCPAGCGNHLAADIGFQGARVKVGDEVLDAVSIFVGGKTGINPQPGVKVIELLPVNMLEAFVEVIINNLDMLRKVKPDADGRIIMIPAISAA